MALLDKDALGRAGERRAALHYLVRGWRIVGRNVREHGAEIDLIARRGRVIAFVEVKTRRESDAGEPWESLREGQRRRIMRAAEGWLAAHASDLGDDDEIRFDVVSITKTRWRFRVERFEGAFTSDAEPGRPWRR
ncbi:MAG: YraN family protein [Acidobacteria bacterium]|nr:YraN family protein [Acidobacteriota bacterium]